MNSGTLRYPTDRLITGSELLDHPEWGHCELVRGKILPLTPPFHNHGLITFSLAAPIGAFVKRKRLGKVTCNDAGVYIARNPNTVRGPDVAFFSNARIKKDPHPEGYANVPPDLCVEVVSPDDRWTELTEKVDDYLFAGVRLVSVVDPPRRKAHVYAPNRAVQVLRETDKLLGEDVLPGFKLPLKKVFAELD